MSLYNSNLPHATTVTKKRGSAYLVVQREHCGHMSKIEACFTTMQKASTFIERLRSSSKDIRRDVEKVALQ